MLDVLLRDVTLYNILQQRASMHGPSRKLGVAFEIDGLPYYSATDIARALEVSRQTLWRWRKGGVIPAGHRFRDRRVLYTTEEVEQIHRYAHHVEPIARPEHGQLGLFNGSTAEVGEA